mgnify:CR=1 FL=1
MRPTSPASHRRWRPGYPVSLRVRNFETGKLKVNDSHGNPIEIAAVVVWKVVDTAEAVFEVDDYVNYVHVQSEAAVRTLATGYPYDVHDEDEVSLVGNIAEVPRSLPLDADLMAEGVEVLVVASLDQERPRDRVDFVPESAGA